jgi:SAM-dependent methyltransferase
MTEASAQQLRILTQMYPEMSAGGFSHVDGTVQFYTRVNALLTPAMSVVDYGAGRGEWARDPVAYRRELRALRGKVREVIGADIDAAVQSNESVDRCVLCPDAATIPLDDSSVDLIVSDHTFEHLDRPADIAREMARILRPGGWICARTPNRFGYIAAATSLIPNRRHAAMLRALQPGREAIDVFPTRYRLNTLRAVSRYFPSPRFANYSYYWAGEPSYFGRSQAVARLIRAGCGVLPSSMQPKLFIFLRMLDD